MRRNTPEPNDQIFVLFRFELGALQIFHVKNIRLVLQSAFFEISVQQGFENFFSMISLKVDAK